MANLTWSTGYNFNVGQGVVANGFWYIPNASPGTLSKTDLNGTIIETSWCSQLTGAQCCVQYGGDLYVATLDNISKVTLTEPPVVSTFVELGNGIGLTVNADYLYVANGNRISRISLVGGTDNLDWATGTVEPAGLAIYGTDLYSANISGAIYKIPLSTGVFDPSWTIDFGAALLGLDVYGTNLYVSIINGATVQQISLITKAVTTFTAFGESGRAVVVYDAHVYAGYGSSTIGKFSIYDLTWSTGYAFDFGQAVVANGFVYVPNSNVGTISKTQLDGTILDSAWCSGLTTPQACVQYGGYLYVSTGTTITKVSLATAAKTEFASRLSNGYGLAIYGTDLYVADKGIGYIVSKISLTGGTTSLDWATVPSDTSVIGLAVSGTDLYCAGVSGNIFKIPFSSGIYDPTWTLSLGIPLYGAAIYGAYLYVSNINGGYVMQISLINTSERNAGFAILPSKARAVMTYAAKLYASYGADIDTKTIATWTLDALPDPPVPPLVCFKEDSKILTDKGYIPIQDLRKGDLVKTVRHGFKPIDMIGKRDIVHTISEERIKDQLYKCSQSEYPELIEPLVITGCHAILVDNFTSKEQREKSIEVLGDIYVTDKKYRLPACVDERATVYEQEGECTIYHVALENDNYYMNYGIYANGLLVETCSKRYLKELSNMALIE